MTAAGLLLTSLAFVACSQDDAPETAAQQPRTLTITVGDQGFQPAGGLTTRTPITYSGTATTFQSGDEIGIYIVRDGGYVDRTHQDADPMVNKRFRFDGEGWREVYMDNNVEKTRELLYYEGAIYFAYFPYIASEPQAPNPSHEDFVGVTSKRDKGDAALVLSSLDAYAREFFADKIRVWHPAHDQHTHDLYASQDLMVAMGKIGDDNSSLNFTFVHQMSLVELNLNANLYSNPTSNSYRIANYKPWNITENLNRMLVKPDTEYYITGAHYSGTTKIGTWELHIPAQGTGSLQYNNYVTYAS